MNERITTADGEQIDLTIIEGEGTWTRIGETDDGRLFGTIRNTGWSYMGDCESDVDDWKLENEIG